MPTSSGPVDILMIEDSNLIVQNIRDLFASTGKPFNIESAGTLTEGLNILQQRPKQVVLLDLILPDSDGFNTFLATYTSFPDVPIIVMTGLDDESMALNAVRHGAQDYIVKSGSLDPQLLVRSVRYAIERKRIEDDLRRARTELEYRVQERTSELQDANAQLRREIAERTKAEEELQVAYKQLKDAQTQLIYSEKMEIVGRLASGVAHEVKNPLAILLQGIEFLHRKVDTANENVRATLRYMGEAVVRADSIIKGLLDFSRTAELNVAKYDLHVVIEHALLLMKHEFDKHHIELVKNYYSENIFLNVDNNKIEQVFLNLVMNSIDAMQPGGRIQITTRLCQVSDLDAQLLDSANRQLFRSSDYVAFVEIEDSGSGIPEEMLNKVFFPFITTKQAKGGTGLGLPIVKNIMDMHQASIVLKNKTGGGGVIAALAFKV